VISAEKIADDFNKMARELAPQFLPNGFLSKSKQHWMASGIRDTGKSSSLFVNLTGPKIGRWRDMGNCGADEARGDMLDLLRLTQGLADAGAAFAEAKRMLGIHDPWTPEAKRADPAVLAQRAAEAQARAAAHEAELEKDRAAKARQAQRLWLSGAPIAGTPAEFYLRARELDKGMLEWPGSLRYHGEVWCAPLSVKVPAMLATILRADGVQVGTHRTFLANDARHGWGKIDSPNAKMVLGAMWGGFIPIHKGASGKPMAAMAEDDPVYVTEGIEDAICVRMMRPEARIIAAISLGNIGAILLPPAARRLVIVCDRDDNQAALDQLERSIAQQEARGLDVGMVMPPTECNGMKIKDMNDWLRAVNLEERDKRQRKGRA